MNEKKTLKIIDDFGKEIEYEILIAFKWTKTNKNYMKTKYILFLALP